MHQQQTAFIKHCGKQRNCSSRAISSFPTMFSLQSDNCTSFAHIFDIIFLFAAELEEPKIGISGKALTIQQNFGLDQIESLYTLQNK